ncbi:MAG: Ig-like domain-containing protein [Undibacterium sp.]|nr:Ig-like domain-containing protein [Opitutaceae bacterium]
MHRRFFPIILTTLLAAPLGRAALHVTRFFPASGADAVSPDTPLRLKFSAAPAFGASGKIRLHDAVTQSVIETIDVQAPIGSKTIGGLDHYNYYTVLIVGDEATLVPKPGALAYGRGYYVTVDAGAFISGADAVGGLDQPNAWHFTTRPGPPAPGAQRLTVAADGTGDFCTVQGALDFIPDGNTAPVRLFIRKGTYREIVFFTDKHHVTILGEDRRETVIAYANNAKFNVSGGNPFAGRAPDPSAENPRASGNIYRRGMFLAHRVNDFTLANLTLRNLTPSGGSQAEALIVNGTTTGRTIIKDVDFYSFQDTIQINGQAYLDHCFVEGDVDFMWGTGPAFFENCTARTLRSGAYYTQVRNPATHHGFVYLHCTFGGAPGIADNFLSRIEPHRFPHSEVVFVDCVLGPSVGALGWQLQASSPSTPPAATDDLKFWEFNSRTPAGGPIDVAHRLPASRQLQLPSAAALLADYRNPAFVLGGNWQPRLAPIFNPPPAAASTPPR